MHGFGREFVKAGGVARDGFEPVGFRFHPIEQRRKDEGELGAFDGFEITSESVNVRFDKMVEIRFAPVLKRRV